MVDLRRISLCLPLVFALPLVSLGCTDDGGETSSSEGGSETQGDGDGDATGDGDGDATGDGDGDASGDGDGDASGDGDGDGMPLGCELFDNGTPQAVTAALSAGEAATAPIVPAPGTVYEITLPEGAAGFIELQIADWETTQTFYTTADIDYTVSTEAGQHVPGPREPLVECDGMTSQGYFFPHWTPATLEFSATGPREIQLIVIES